MSLSTKRTLVQTVYSVPGLSALVPMSANTIAQPSQISELAHVRANLGMWRRPGAANYSARSSLLIREV